jgi:CheY-like chemotaxis protein
VARAARYVHMGPTVNRHDLQPGNTLGRYWIAEQLGAGGMGTVWAARDETLRRPVAIKVLHGEDADAAVAEARAMAAVRHPNVVTVYSIERERYCTFVVMERIDGMSLDRILLERGPLPPGEVVRIVNAVAAALGAIHRAGILHGDVKPSNILLERFSDRVVVTDFGLAGETEEEVDGRCVRGTPDYLCPERASGAPIQGELRARQDVYALACAAFELLTGRVPYEHVEIHRVLRAHAYAEIPRASELRRSLGWRVDRALASALAKDPARRTPTPAAFAADLATAVAKGAARARILVVEDDPLERHHLTAALARRIHGIALVSRGDGESGYRAAVAERPDLIVLDLAMPEMNGVELCAVLRATPGLEAVPIVVVSGAASEPERRVLARLGVTEILEKPIHPPQIVDSVRRLLGAPQPKRPVARPETPPSERRATLDALAVSPTVPAAVPPTIPPPVAPSVAPEGGTP